ncbi:MAG: 5'-nucleotidase C-terminal domain-containing protein, partial [Rhizobacter sp.]|nr:5'-nucleotidase C-terminal domain-containing protein [Rhizobacter sp.]
QGGDMVRVGGLQYTCTPGQVAGARISDMRLGGKPIEAAKTYKVGGWAPVAEGAQGEPIWDVMEKYLRDQKVIKPRKLNAPKLVGVANNPGLA